MRKWRNSTVCCMALLLLSVSNVMAKGIFITPGARANAMGGAFSAIASDLTAIYWNPAGIAGFSGKYGVEASGFNIADKVKSNHSLFNSAMPDSANGDFPFPNMLAAVPLLPQEPAEYGNKALDVAAFLPFVAGYGKIKDVTIAAGFYAVGGGGGKWKDSVAAGGGADTINASLEATSKVITIYNVSAAKAVSPQLSIGLGLDWVNMNDSLEVRKDYVRGSGSAVPDDYSFYNKDSANGAGLQVNAGALYAFRENLRAALVFRSGTTIKLKGSSHFTQSGLGWMGVPSLANADLTSDYEKNYSYPMTYSLGVSYDPAKKLTLALGLEQVNYSTMNNDVTYATPVAGVFVNQSGSAHWKDVTQLQIGAQYRANKKLSLMAGVKTDPTPYQRDKATLLDTNQFDFTYVGLGAAYDFGAFNVAGAYINGISEKITKGDRTYEFPLNMFSLSVGYRFK